ncbi:YdeI/OmpD-associated family protein [Sphingopyxis witflariensis]|uniref:Uncharacterized protein n=1 Tax=Sphingopyxis witflariensis TaxID=173675 RepID=A0A246JIQ5_9SPHN|nr:hypothetical protein CDQ91_18430 [Sphingopyxis witflariensis]
MCSRRAGRGNPRPARRRLYREVTALRAADLRAAFACHHEAQAYWDAFSPGKRRDYMEWCWKRSARRRA